MEPTLMFVYNKSDTDVPYDFSGSNPNWGEITPGVDRVIITGGGIADADVGMGDATLVSGTRSPTIKPSQTSYVIPYIYVESGSTMYYVPLGSNQGAANTTKYVFGVVISGTIHGDLYCEAWDSISFSTYDLPVLSGTVNNDHESCVNAMNTVWAADADGGTVPYPWDGDTTGCSYLRGQSNRVSLGFPRPVISITDTVVYFKFYIRLETDSPTFHNVPIIAFRYLYI